MMHGHQPRPARSCLRPSSVSNLTTPAPGRYGLWQTNLSFLLGISIMDKCDFFLRYTGLDKFSADILIDIEGSIVLRRAEVAEQQLGQLIRLSFLINPKHIPHTGS